MHGLINRSLQYFLCQTYGAHLWTDVALSAGADPEGFEAMLTYDDAITFALIDGAAARLGTPRSALLEDYGNFLVSLRPLRRLMRFGGHTYADFLASLDELPGRAEMAVAEISLPALDPKSLGRGRFAVLFAPHWDGFDSVLAGLLRAMADDYGALAVIEHGNSPGVIEVELLEERYSEGRDFLLSDGAAA